MSINKSSFLLLTLFITSCFILPIPSAVNGQSKEKYITRQETKSRALKITKIKGLVIICEQTKGYCNLEDFSKFVRNISTKILTRDHLDAILSEQSLVLSGLTQEEKSIKIGKLLQASHILLYCQSKEGEHLFVNNVKLINISTSEIEYQAKLYTLVSGAGIEDEELTKFFNMINYYPE